MADRTTARVRSSYDVIRYVEDDRPSPLTIPYRGSSEDRFGATGEAGYTDGENDTDEVFDAVLELAGAAQVLDLTALSDPDGRAVSFARVRYLRVVNTSTVDLVAIGPDGTNGWADAPSAVIYPSTADCEGRLEQVIPDATGGLVDGTSKRISFDPGAATLSVNVLIVGIKV